MKWHIIKLRRHTARPWLAVKEPSYRYQPSTVKKFHTHAEAVAFVSAQHNVIEATA